MITTPRSIAVGLTAWIVAFLVVYVCRVDPTQLTPFGVAILAIGAVSGFIAAILLGKRFCHRRFERGNAVMVFSFSFFAGIYAPITAICANATLYKWSETQTVRADSRTLARYVAPAVEHTASSHYAGAILLLGLCWLAARRIAGTTRFHQQRLGWPEPPDIGFALAAWIVGAVVSFVRALALMSVIYWLEYTSAAFLLSMIFRSIRLQWRTLGSVQSSPVGPCISRTAAFVTISSLWIGFPLCALVGIWLDLSMEWQIALWFIGCMLPWGIFRLFTRGQNEARDFLREDLTAFAVRCGFWAGVATELLIGGLVLTGIAANILEKASQMGDSGLATPFALTVIALKPIYNLFALPFCMTLLGGFLVAAILPSSTRATERIMACAHGGAAMSLVSCVFIILCAFSLALLAVPLIPLGKPLSPKVTTYFAQGHWPMLGSFYLGVLATTAAGGAMLWATKASIVCGFIWLKNRCIPKVPATVPPPSPSKNPPHAPSA